MKLLTCLMALALPLLAACAGPLPPGQDARILVMGDSLLAWNSGSGKSVAFAVEEALQAPVADRSVPGARVIYRLPLSGAAGMSIRKQYRDGDWDWIIVNGGGNDLWLGCGCMACNRKMDRLISEDGRRGAIPELLSELRGTGARVIYAGYLRSPGRGSLIEHCRDEGDELDRRLAKLAALDGGIYFVPNAGLVPEGDRSYHALDMIHPSPKASKAIGERIARVIRSAPPGG
ncbi:SGNH/GDSL hydrolase family protein [Roseobacteraceae bacterium NS-SX3]